MALQNTGVKAVVEGLSKFESDMTRLNGKVDTVGGSIAKHSASFKKAGLAMVGAAAGVGIGSLKMGADFDNAMRKVNTMMLLGEEEFQSLSDQVLQVAKDVGKAPTEMADALYQVVSAGVPAGKALQFLETSAKAAIGGATDTETAVDGLTTVINAFSKDASEADKIADIMFTTVKGGKTTFNELSGALFNVAPIAAASNIKFEEVAAALATMTKQGVPTKIATTQLRQAMVALQKPTEDMNRTITSLGFASGQAMVEEKGLAETLNMLRDSTGGSNEMLMKMFGSVEAGQAVLALTGANASMFTADIESMAMASDGAGAAMDAFNEMNKGASRQFEQLMVQVKGTAIEIGAALMPAILGLVKALTPVLEKVGKWIEDNPKLTTVLIAVTGAVGGLLLGLGFLPAVISGITAAFGALNAVMIANPIGAIIAGIALLIATIVILVKKWDTMSTKAKALGIGLLMLLGPIGQIAAGAILIWKNWDKIIKFFQNIPQKIKDTFMSLKDIIVKPFEAAINAIIGLFNSMIGLISGKELFSIPAKSILGKQIFPGWSLSLPTLPKIPKLQYGGLVSGSGLFQVGERGPEVVTLPAGAAVSPATMNNTSYNINANYTNPQEPQGIALDLESILMLARA